MLPERIRTHLARCRAGFRRAYPWLIARGQEASTIRSVILAVGTLTGMHYAPDKADAIATLGTLAVTAVAVATKEHRDDDSDPS